MIKVHHDGKGKYQSWEAMMDVNASEGMYHGNAQLCGYGATEQEAVDNLMTSIGSLYSLTLMVFKGPIEYVDCLGEPLAKKV